ncbi:MAG: xanthine dehydrogenase family protein subunit M [Gammaproteobacteria bacterium]|nr:xanthine dehydrogenase family protein subunit M [Gammaproteobacteria bacterium]MDP2141511.1 xanthine dehydrogenase family protein subunit M [Gammaproteobacteria bacterium]MDP2347464.1 xanthine dehydrogenase family protein subunit M [Gammaproteobacteria bacterium]
MSSHDVMPDMGLYQPVTVEDAAGIARQFSTRGWLVGGGQDTYGWLKDRAKRPEVLIDLKGIESMRGIRETADGIEIGALVTLTELTTNSLITGRYSLLAEAAGRVASPQIRNVGTIAGNVAQDVRCWYYRRGLNCYRAGGNLCYADTPEGMNREHALFNASRCVAVTASDTGPALVALEAQMVIHNGSSERVVSAENFFVGPNIDITHTTVLRPGEILTAVRIPAKWANAEFYFEKVADRNVWDFALVSISAAMRVNNGVIEESRLVAGAVEATPRRLDRIEQAIRGKARNQQTADEVAALAIQGARPLNFNHFKMPLLENLVNRAVRGHA